MSTTFLDFGEFGCNYMKPYGCASPIKLLKFISDMPISLTLWQFKTY